VKSHNTTLAGKLPAIFISIILPSSVDRGSVLFPSLRSAILVRRLRRHIIASRAICLRRGGQRCDLVGRARCCSDSLNSIPEEHYNTINRSEPRKLNTTPHSPLSIINTILMNLKPIYSRDIANSRFRRNALGVLQQE
jgi:hypothetical protein